MTSIAAYCFRLNFDISKFVYYQNQGPSEESCIECCQAHDSGMTFILEWVLFQSEVRTATIDGARVPADQKKSLPDGSVAFRDFTSFYKLHVKNPYLIIAEIGAELY